MYKIATDIDEETVFQLCSKLSISIDEIDIAKIRWKVEDTYLKDDILHIPIKAVGYKVIPKKNQLSDAELQQALEQQPLKYLSDLCVEQFHTDCLHCPILEIQSAPIPDGIPLLHKG